MAIEAQAKIVLKGGSEALRALQGVTRGTSAASKAAKDAAKESDRANRAAIKAHQERMRAAERADKAVAKSAQQAARVQARAATDAAKAADKSARDIEKSAQREADRWQRLAQQSLRVREKAMQDATRTAQREAGRQEDIARKSAASQVKAGRSVLRAAGGAVGIATGAALAGGYAAASTARSVGGAKSIQERIQSGNEFRERLFGVTSAAGMSAGERENVQAQVLSASQSTGTDAGELMSVLETGHGQFNNLKFFADNLQEIATIAKVAQADTGDFAKAVGSVQQAFGLTGKEAIEAAYLMKAGADKGSVELKDFARDFAAGAGIFAQNTKQTGIGGVRQFLGTAQGIATGQFGSAESSTRLERLAADLNDVDVRKGLSDIGIKNIADSRGKIDVGGLLDKLGTNQKFKSAATRQGIFKETRSLQAVEALIAARERGKSGGVDFKSIAGVDAAAGKDAVAAGFSGMQNEGFFKFQQENAKMQAETTKNLESYNAQTLKVLQMSNKLELAFGSLALWASSIAAMGLGGLATGAAGKLLAGGGAEGGGVLAKALPTLAKGGTAAASGIGAALAAGSTTVAAAGGAALAGTVAGGLAIGGAAGTVINQVPAWFRDDGQTLSDLIVSRIMDGKRESQLTSGGTRNADGTAIQKDIVRELKDINSGLRATNTKPKAGASREPG